jgi:hypothetical protein
VAISASNASSTSGRSVETGLSNKARSGSTARRSPRVASPWMASRRTSSSTSSSRAASAARRRGNSAAVCPASPNVAQSRTSGPCRPGQLSAPVIVEPTEIPGDVHHTQPPPGQRLRGDSGQIHGHPRPACRQPRALGDTQLRHSTHPSLANPLQLAVPERRPVPVPDQYPRRPPP